MSEPAVDGGSGPLLKVTLKPRRSRPFFARHPWVFADSIARIEGDTRKIDEAALYSHEGAFIARGLFNPQSKLRLRLFRWEDAPLDDAFWAGRLGDALAMRAALPKNDLDETARRLVFAEGDRLSGLIVDQFADAITCQWTSQALYRRKELIEHILLSHFPGCRLVSQGDASTADKEGFTPDQIEPKVISGNVGLGELINIRHGGLQFQVNPLGGQKTGFFLDQGVNRHRVAAYAQGRNVLDLFCYSGGFGLAAAKFGNAATIMGVDSSKPAIALAEKNRALNGIDENQLTFMASDVAKALKKLAEAERKFGLVVCDPPKYARSRENLEDALKAYRHLNENAIKLVEPGGYLATFTCSGTVEPAIFDDVMARAAEYSGRTLQIMERLAQPPDHPVDVACPESRYLYGLILRVS